MNEDCKVCQKLIKQKHKNDIIWKIACLIFAALAIVLGILYFGRGAFTTENKIIIEGTTIENGGDDGSIIIGDNNEVVKGKVESTDYTPLICISAILSATIITGGIIYAYHIKTHDNDNN